MTSSQPASQAPPIFLHNTMSTLPCQLHLKLKFSKTGAVWLPTTEANGGPKAGAIKPFSFQSGQGML